MRLSSAAPTAVTPPSEHREVNPLADAACSLRPPRAPLLASALAVLVGLSLLLAACGGSPESTTSRSPSSQTLSFSRCMRSKGIRSFPDSDGSGQLPKPQVVDAHNSDPARFDAADGAFRHLLPDGGGGTTQAEVQQEWTEMRSVARCMRRHGVPQWPDPVDRPDGTRCSAHADPQRL